MNFISQFIEKNILVIYIIICIIIGILIYYKIIPIYALLILFLI